ncbi:MAG: hypothetical protein JOY67_12735 [Hyphomicrobiales bacterium]|nr:hypothetical protein [Hyphomicrobiales bacterium]MBV9519100.1 hypothetical protein [Hyphomicrobiales bacterium]
MSRRNALGCLLPAQRSQSLRFENDRGDGDVCRYGLVVFVSWPLFWAARHVNFLGLSIEQIGSGAIWRQAAEYPSICDSFATASN